MNYKSYSLEYNRLDYQKCYTQNIMEIKKDIDKLFGNPLYFFNVENLEKKQIRINYNLV